MGSLSLPQRAGHMDAALALPEIEVGDANTALDPRLRLGDDLGIGKSGEPSHHRTSSADCVLKLLRILSNLAIVSGDKFDSLRRSCARKRGFSTSRQLKPQVDEIPH